MPYALKLAFTSSIELRTPRQARLTVQTASAELPLEDIQVPQMVAVPPSVEIAGTVVDLTPLASLLEPVSHGLQGVQAACRFATHPEVSTGGARFVSFFLTTYIDASLRIARGADNEVLIFARVEPLARK